MDGFAVLHKPAGNICISTRDYHQPPKCPGLARQWTPIRTEGQHMPSGYVRLRASSFDDKTSAQAFASKVHIVA